MRIYPASLITCMFRRLFDIKTRDQSPVSRLEDKEWSELNTGVQRSMLRSSRKSAIQIHCFCSHPSPHPGIRKDGGTFKLSPLITSRRWNISDSSDRPMGSLLNQETRSLSLTIALSAAGVKFVQFKRVSMRMLGQQCVISEERDYWPR